MNLDYWSQLDMRFGVITVVAILIGGFVATFSFGFGLNVSNGPESNIEEREATEIISEIRSLLKQTLTEYQNGNFSGSLALAEEAYLENYEFIKDPLAEQDITLMEDIDIMLRGQLRDQVTGNDPDADVPRLVKDLNSNLEKAAAILANKTEK